MMKLSNIDYELIWPNDVKINNLRKYIIDNLSQKGDIVRWSLNNIKIPDKLGSKVLNISAVIIN